MNHISTLSVHLKLNHNPYCRPCHPPYTGDGAWRPTRLLCGGLTGGAEPLRRVPIFGVSPSYSVPGGISSHHAGGCAIIPPSMCCQGECSPPLTIMGHSSLVYPQYMRCVMSERLTSIYESLLRQVQAQPTSADFRQGPQWGCNQISNTH